MAITNWVPGDDGSVILATRDGIHCYAPVGHGG